MRLKKQGWAGLAMLAAFCALGVAAAQPAAAPAQPSTEVGAQREVALTPQQMLDESNKYLPEMDRGAIQVRRQLEQAREARDVVKVLCLNDKLNQVDVAIRSAKDRQPSLRAAVERKDDDRAKHEFTVIQVLRDRVTALVQEAQQCIGEEQGFVGESRVTVDIDPNIPPSDPSDFPDDPLISIPPVHRSPAL